MEADRTKKQDAHFKLRWQYLFYFLLLLLVIFLILAVVRSCSIKPKLKKPPIPVSVATAIAQDVPVYLNALGSVVPIDTVTVKTQIDGILQHVYYREGQLVKINDVIAQIDPRPYLAQLEQFEGQLARDAAQLANARVDLKRYAILYPKGAVSQQVYATQAALVKQLEGTIQLDQGQIDQVKVNLIYCRIVSPINGRVGLRLVDPGNFVQTTDTTGLVVINEMQPITVVFALPEDNIPAVTQAVARQKTVIAKAYDRTQQQLLDTGELITLDNEINTATGTVNLRAQFPNKKWLLFPNQFVNVNLLVNVLRHATLTPTAAVQRGPQGEFVFVLNKNQTVSVQAIKTGITQGENTVIESGVNPGQQVVVEGADQLVDGARVSVATKAHA